MQPNSCDLPCLTNLAMPIQSVKFLQSKTFPLLQLDRTSTRLSSPALPFVDALRCNDFVTQVKLKLFGQLGLHFRHLLGGRLFSVTTRVWCTSACNFSSHMTRPELISGHRATISGCKVGRAHLLSHSSSST